MILPLKCLLALSVLVCVQNKEFKGYILYEFVVKTKKQIISLIPFFNRNCIEFFEHIVVGRNCSAFVSPECQNWFTRGLNYSHIEYEIKPPIKKLSLKVGQEKEYPTADKIFDWMDGLAVNFSQRVELTTIGQSYEKRNLTVIQVSSNPKAHKPIIFVNAAIHGRNWIGPVVIQYFVIQLLQISSDLLEYVDWHFLPLANPDGYVYSQDHDDLWRKTRSHRGECIGVDINRNFDCHWNASISSEGPCGGNYGGPSAFSESETRSIADYITTHKNRIKLYLSFHNYGNYIIFPWGYASKLPDDYKELRKLAEDVNDAMVRAGSGRYTIGTVSEVCPSANGIDVDWVKAQAGVELAYIIEFPRRGSLRYNPPLSQMFAVSRQACHGMEVFGKYISKKFGK